jgi:DNA repair protein RecO (recombination protein O)
MGRSYKTDAIVLRSIRFSEADRVLHLFTLERGRVNAIAKGVRKTGSRFGARLEPLTRSALILHEGRGELHTVSGADIISSQQAVRADGYALAVGLIGAEAVLKLFAEPEPQPRAYEGSCRFLELLAGPLERAADPQHDGLGLAFQLKLLALAGYLPHLVSCAAGGSAGPLVGFSPAAGGAVCAVCLTTAGGFPLSDGGIAAIESLLDRPLQPVALAAAAAADALRVVRETYAHHGGFRLRTLSSA